MPSNPNYIDLSRIHKAGNLMPSDGTTLMFPYSVKDSPKTFKAYFHMPGVDPHSLRIEFNYKTNKFSISGPIIMKRKQDSKGLKTLNINRCIPFETTALFDSSKTKTIWRKDIITFTLYKVKCKSIGEPDASSINLSKSYPVKNKSISVTSPQSLKTDAIPGVAPSTISSASPRIPTKAPSIKSVYSTQFVGSGAASIRTVSSSKSSASPLMPKSIDSGVSIRSGSSNSSSQYSASRAPSVKSVSSTVVGSGASVRSSYSSKSTASSNTAKLVGSSAVSIKSTASAAPSVRSSYTSRSTASTASTASTNTAKLIGSGSASIRSIPSSKAATGSSSVSIRSTPSVVSSARSARSARSTITTRSTKLSGSPSLRSDSSFPNAQPVDSGYMDTMSIKSSNSSQSTSSNSYWGWLTSAENNTTPEPKAVAVQPITKLAKPKANSDINYFMPKREQYGTAAWVLTELEAVDYAFKSALNKNEKTRKLIKHEHDDYVPRTVAAPAQTGLISWLMNNGDDKPEFIGHNYKTDRVTIDLHDDKLLKAMKHKGLPTFDYKAILNINDGEIKDCHRHLTNRLGLLLKALDKCCYANKAGLFEGPK